MNARIESLALIATSVWQQLTLAAGDREHGWRQLTLATWDGQRPQLRTVILREVQAAQRRLVFFTDARSPKVEQLRAEPCAGVHCWSAALGWQLRLDVHCNVFTEGAEVAARWSRMKNNPAANDYLSPLPPASPLAERYAPQPADRAHFAVVIAQVQAIDWLELHVQGHRRARIDAAGARWLQP